MANYYIDTEFIEGTQKKTFLGFNFGETKPTIDLISIGIVAEDNREFYAVSKDFNLKEAWNRWQYNEKFVSAKNQQGKEYWIRENVLKPIYKELHFKENLYAKQVLHRANVYIPETDFDFTYNNLKRLINKYGKTNKQIANEVQEFCLIKVYDNKGINVIDIVKPKFYGYFADYDWVVFCWLFGKMNDLPNGFPYYCSDLKQILDEKANKEEFSHGYKKGYGLTYLQEHKDYPKQTNEHNALADAKWNKELHNFLNSL